MAHLLTVNSTLAVYADLRKERLVVKTLPILATVKWAIISSLRVLSRQVQRALLNGFRTS